MTLKRGGHGGGLPVGLNRHGLRSAAGHQPDDEQKEAKRQATTGRCAGQRASSKQGAKTFEQGGKDRVDVHHVDAR